MIYLDKAEFGEAIKDYYEDQDNEAHLSRLNDMVERLIEKIRKSKSFSGYTFDTDMISDARFKVWRALTNKKYKLERNSPFSYFTSVVRNAFVDVIKKEKKRSEKMATLREYHEIFKDEIYEDGSFLKTMNKRYFDEEEDE